jgi:REP element-mobilizing transposase RayT
MWMKDGRVAEAVAGSLRKLDGDAYRLDAYSVMSNHVHAVFKPLLCEAELREFLDGNGHPIFIGEHPGLSQIMHSLKGSSARECNLILSRRGQFWEHESFDDVIRPGRFYATIRYVLNNPVKARLVADWREWRWNYCRSDLSDKL